MKEFITSKKLSLEYPESSRTIKGIKSNEDIYSKISKVLVQLKNFEPGNIPISDENTCRSLI